MRCRRKKRCIRFLEAADDCRSSAAGRVAPAVADSTSDVTMTSLRGNTPGGPGFSSSGDCTDKTAMTSPVRRQMTACDSSAPNGSLRWTSLTPGYPHMTSPPSASVRWRQSDVVGLVLATRAAFLLFFCAHAYLSRVSSGILDAVCRVKLAKSVINFILLSFTILILTDSQCKSWYVDSTE